MSAGGGANTAGRSVPANVGVAADVEIFENADDSERIFDLGTETTSIIVRANPNNSGNVFIGFSESVDSNSGFLLEPGDSITLAIDVNEVPVWGIAATANDEVRFMAIR